MSTIQKPSSFERLNHIKLHFGTCLINKVIQFKINIEDIEDGIPNDWGKFQKKIIEHLALKEQTRCVDMNSDSGVHVPQPIPNSIEKLARLLFMMFSNRSDTTRLSYPGILFFL